jgi:hypothetical protein
MLASCYVQGRSTRLVLSNHDFLNHIASTDLDLVGRIKGTGNLSTSDEGQSLDAFKVGMLDRHDTLFGEEGFGVIVDELSVDKASDTVSGNGSDLCLHLVLKDINRVSDKVETCVPSQHARALPISPFHPL